MIKRYILLSFAVLSMLCLFTLLAPNTASAALFSGSKEQACKGANLRDTAAAASSCGDKAETQTSNLIRRIVNLFTIVVGVVAVIMIIVSGFRFITAGGDANNVTAARNGLLYAVIGLVIVAFAQVITRFVLTKTT